jgi:hypothetical protein
MNQKISGSVDQNWTKFLIGIFLVSSGEERQIVASTKTDRFRQEEKRSVLKVPRSVWFLGKMGRINHHL